MISTLFLVDDIIAEIEKDFAEVTFDTKTDIKKPNIWIGHAPPKKSKPTGSDTPPLEIGDPPFIIVRYMDDETKNDEHGASVLESRIGILCCIYSKDSYEDMRAGYMDIENMTDRIILTLIKKLHWGQKRWWRHGSIKRTFGVEKEISSVYEAGSQDRHFYGAAVVVTFRAAAIASPVI